MSSDLITTRKIIDEFSTTINVQDTTPTWKNQKPLVSDYTTVSIELDNENAIRVALQLLMHSRTKKKGIFITAWRKSKNTTVTSRE